MGVMGMTLGSLIESSAQIFSSSGKSSYSMIQALSKEFGQVYYNDKVVYYNAEYKIIELRMLMGIKTETSGAGMHAIRMAIYGAEGKEYDSLDELRRDLVMKVAKGENDLKSDPNKSGAIRSASQNQIRHEGKGTERYMDSDHKLVTTNDKNTRGVADRSIRTDTDARDTQFIGGTDEEEEVENYMLEHFRGIILPRATVSDNIGQNFKHDGGYFYLKQPIGINSLVRVSCSCSNYYYVMAPYNDKVGAHLGASPALYIKKNKRKGPVMNASRKPGMCKHLMLFTMLLIGGGILNEVSESDISNWDQALKDNKKFNKYSASNVPEKVAYNSGELTKRMKKLQKDIHMLTKSRGEENGGISPARIYSQEMAKLNYAHNVEELKKAAADKNYKPNVVGLRRNAGVGSFLKNQEYSLNRMSKGVKDLRKDVAKQLFKKSTKLSKSEWDLVDDYIKKNF